MKKKLIDWENLFDLTHEVQSICGTCPSANKCRIRNRPPDCPIWASLEDAPSVIEIECSVCGAQITEYIDTGEREIREAEYETPKVGREEGE